MIKRRQSYDVKNDITLHYQMTFSRPSRIAEECVRIPWESNFSNEVHDQKSKNTIVLEVEIVSHLLSTLNPDSNFSFFNYIVQKTMLSRATH